MNRPVCAVIFAVLSCMPALGERLRDENSTVDINFGAQDGIYSWVVNGHDILPQQWFWYRIGANKEQSIDTMALLSHGAENDFGEPGPDRAYASYSNGAGLGLNMEITLDDAGPYANLLQVLRWTNTSGTAIDLTVFLYSNFTLGGTNVLTLRPGTTNAFEQSGDFFNARIRGTASSMLVHHEANTATNTLDRLNTQLPYVTLDDSNTSSGNVTAAFQWHTTIAAHDSFTMGVDETVTVPEPASIALGLGGLGLLVGIGRFVRRRRTS